MRTWRVRASSLSSIAPMGSGSVQGFAVTLILGIIVSLLTAVIITKHLTKLVIGTHLFGSGKFYGI